MAKEPVNPGFVDAYTGEMIKQARERKGLTQEEFAKKIGVSSGQLQNYESGAVRVPILRMFRVARELDVSVRALLPDSIEE